MVVAVVLLRTEYFLDSVEFFMVFAIYAPPIGLVNVKVNPVKGDACDESQRQDENNMSTNTPSRTPAFRRLQPKSDLTSKMQSANTWSQLAGLTFGGNQGIGYRA